MNASNSANAENTKDKKSTRDSEVGVVGRSFLEIFLHFVLSLLK